MTEHTSTNSTNMMSSQYPKIGSNNGLAVGFGA